MTRSSLDMLFSVAIAGLLSTIIWLAASESLRPIDDAMLAPTGGFAVGYRNVASGYDAYAVGEPKLEVAARGLLNRGRSLDDVAPDVAVWVDLAGLVPDAATHELDVHWSCRACARRGVRVLGTHPATLAVRFDPLVTETRPVLIQIDEADDQPMVVEERTADPDVVSVNGPARFVARVRSVVAHVDPAVDEGRDTQYSALLIGEDRQAMPVPRVTLMPPMAIVTLSFDRRGYRLPVAPEIIGDVPPGYFWSRMLFEPSEVTVAGDSDAMAALLDAGRVDTDAIDLSGVTADSTFSTTLRLPAGVEPLDLPSGTVTVTIQVRRQPSSRAIDVPVIATGLSPSLAFTPSPGSVRVLIIGPQPVVEAVKASDIRASVDVSGLPAGRHRLEVTVTPPRELEALTITPDLIEVVLERLVGGPEPTTRPRSTP